MQQNITAEEKKKDQKVGSLLYKETEEGKLNFKLSYLSLPIDWVLFIKINSKGDYHFYPLSSLKIYMPLAALLSLFFFPPFILSLLCLYRQLPRRNSAFYPIVLPFLIGFLWKYTYLQFNTWYLLTEMPKWNQTWPFPRLCMPSCYKKAVWFLTKRKEPKLSQLYHKLAVGSWGSLSA